MLFSLLSLLVLSTLCVWMTVFTASFAPDVSISNGPLRVYLQNSKQALTITPTEKVDYAIPPRLVFTFKFNLLQHQDVSDLSQTDRLILDNVRHTISMYKQRNGVPVDILFWGDSDCVNAISSFGIGDAKLSHIDSEALLRYYKAETTPGAIKGDLCRAIALYNLGGYYLDVDLLTRIPLWDLIDPRVDFTTARNAYWPPPPNPDGEKKGHGQGFFQAVWASRARHPVTLRYLELYNDHAKKNTTDILWGVYALESAYNDVMKDAPTVLTTTSQLIQEGWLEEGKDLDVPRLNGTGCCCHAVVRVNSTVAFYSRAPGTGGSNSCQLP